MNEPTPSWLSSAGVIANGGIRPPGTEGMKASRGSGRGGVVGAKIKKASPYGRKPGEIDKLPDHADQPISRGRLARKPAHNPGTPTPVELRDGGIYVMDDHMYRVRRSRGGFLYALVHTPHADARPTWEMSRGTIKRLTPAMAITFEQACAAGLEFHQCLICGKELTNEVSIELGIGPVCRGKMGWAPTVDSTPTEDEPTIQELSEMICEFEPGTPVWISNAANQPLAGKFLDVAENGQYRVNYVGMEMTVRPERVEPRKVETTIKRINPDDVISGKVKNGPPAGWVPVDVKSGPLPTSGRIDHTTCDHPRTPKARAICRASRKG